MARDDERTQRMPGETVAAIVEAHRSGAASPEATIARAYARIRAHDDPAIFIALRDEADALAEAKALAAERHRALADRPLYGVPVAVKDNIDVAGLPTTAACPPFAYTPTKDATCVARLKRAGAIVIGKTNLDQFATGLVGVRTPYGIARNLFDPALIPGGSSTGSAIAVGAGLVPLALGTDTAGSGRVPAGLRNIGGLQPRLARGRGAALPHPRRRLRARAHRRRRLRRARRHRRPRCRRSVLAPAPARRARRAAEQRAPWRAHAGPAPVLRRRGLGRGLRRGACAPGAARRGHRRVRHRAVLRGGAAPLRGPVGRRALPRDAFADRVGAAVHASGDAPDHPRRREAERGRCIRRVLPARGAAPRARPRLPVDRRHGAA